jgi:hypothetical protein
VNYRVVQDDLVIEDAEGKIHWQGKPEERPVEWAAAVPGSDDGLALYHYYRPDHPYGGFENLVRVRTDGSILWHAQLPAGDDKYVRSWLRDNKLLAYSYGGFDVEINLENGRIIAKRFSK